MHQRHLGQRGIHVELGQRPGHGPQPVGGRGDLLHHLAVDPLLEVGDPLLGIQDQRLVLLQLGGDVPLGVDQRLLADIVGRSALGVGLADLQIVAKDLVVAHLQVP